MSDNFLIERIKCMEKILSDQDDIEIKIQSATEKINKLNIPKDLSKWIDSLSSSDDKFNLHSYKELFKITKEYERLIEMKKNNQSKLKAIVIDDLLDRINHIYENSK